MRQRVWLRHRRREDWEVCPLCGTRLRWVYDGVDWIPCDYEPVLYKFDFGGKYQIVKKRELIDSCIIYESGPPDGYTKGLLPHVYSCYDLNGYGGVRYDR